MTTPHDPIQTWGMLREPHAAPLLESLRRDNSISTSMMMRLRRTWSLELIQAAIELVRAQTKARSKFSNVDQIMADVSGIEQASSECVARHKAARFATLDPDRIVDLCCGIGGDAMSLQRVAPVLAIDRNPLRAWMAGQNAQCETSVAEVQTLALKDIVFHLDPSRRDESATNPRRSWNFESYRPGPEFITQHLRDNQDGVIKLGPGIDFESLEVLGTFPSEIEIINEKGTLTQALLWTGKLAFNAGLRTATKLPEGVQFSGVSVEPTFSEIGRWIHTVDAAVERAGLLGALAHSMELACLHPKLGLLTSEACLESPWLTSFRVEKVLPWRLKNVKAWLDSEEAGIVEVKTRGRAVNPDQVQRQLRGQGDQRFTVFVLRFDKAVRAIIGRRSSK